MSTNVFRRLSRQDKIRMTSYKRNSSKFRNLQNDWMLKPNTNQMMNVDKMVSESIKGLLKDKREIKPGLSGVIKAFSRIAPSFIEKNLGHSEFEKFRQLANK